MAQTGKLGTIDSRLGDVILAFAGADALRPLTGTITGKLGTIYSALGNIRPALSEEEGEGAGGPAIYEVSAESILSLTQSASYQATFNREALSTLSMDQLASLTRVINVDADNTLELTTESSVSAGVWIYDLTAESTLSLTQDATGVLGGIYEVTADNTLALTQEASAVIGEWLHEVTADSTLSITQLANTTVVRVLSASNALELTQEVVGSHIFQLNAENTLAITQACSTFNVFSRSAISDLVLNQTLNVGRPWHVSATSAIQETHQEFIPGTLDIIDVTTGLSSTASVNTVLNLNANSILALSQHGHYAFIEPGGILVSAENTISLGQNAWITEVVDAKNSIVLSQTATGVAGPPVANQLNMQQAAGVTVIRRRQAESELTLGQAATYVLIKHGAVELFDYAPAGLGPLQGPYPGVTSRFALIYPATGSATDTIELRPPNLGNKDRLGFDRINRESRGGTLTVFADPDWPKTQTLVLSFSALYRTEAYELIRFIRDHLGLEIKLSDWEQRVWKGVITTPDEPVVQDSKDSFSASFEFEGELLSA